ncbi:hypothetical protein [Butyricicoccus sp.]|uniref:hypothetical protein n=1 Tax=Butyricicoccus sp. TaxID=2049021 RepID=UPI003D7C78A0
MTLEDTRRQLLSLIEDRRSFKDDDFGIFADDIAALETACELIGTAIKNQNAGRVYTAFDVIRLVQRVVSNESCGLDVENCCAAFEIERGIIAELASEE